MDTNRSSTSTFFTKVGNLKVTIHSLAGLPKNFDGQRFYATVGFGDLEGPTHMVACENGVMQWESAFPFELSADSDHYIDLEVKNEDDDVVGSGRHGISDVLKCNEARAAVPMPMLGPNAEIDVSLYFVEQPPMLPDNIEVNFIAAEDLVGDSKHIDPYCKAYLDNDLLGQIKHIKNGGSDVVWNESIVGRYNGCQLLRIECLDHDTLSHDDLIGDASLDLWEVIKEEASWFKEGSVTLGCSEDNRTIKGRIRISVRFWCDSKDKQQQAIKKAQELHDKEEREHPTARVPYNPPPALLEVSTEEEDESEASLPPAASIVQPSGSPSGMDPVEAKRLADQAQRLMDEADDHAQKARNAAVAAEKVSKTTPTSGAAAHAAKKADNAAKEAQNAADEARRIGGPIIGACQGPSPSRSLHRDLLELESLRDEAERDKKHAKDACREATIASAQEAANRAREAGAATNDLAREIRKVAEEYPEDTELRTIARSGDDDAEHAKDQGVVALQAAENCAVASTIDNALECAAQARKAARSAREREEAAAAKLKRARLLARKNAKYEEKKKQRKLEREREAMIKAQAKKEADKAAEHRREQKRREKQANAADATEHRMYEGAIASSFHRPPMQVKQAASPICCGARRLSSTSSKSLGTKLPPDELRGTIGGQTAAVILGDDERSRLRGDEMGNNVYYEEVFQGTHTGYLSAPTRRPWCWCCGCNCCHCCGEC